MILPDKYLEEVIKYCEFKNIAIQDGKVPAYCENEIKDYIAQRMKKERAITRRLEEESRISIAPTIAKILGVVKPEESPIEEYLWIALERAELSFLAIRQFEIGSYKIDFAFPKYKLAVECDGAEYHRGTELQLERDQKRDKYLARKGWRTLRIEGIAIRRDIQYCMERIRKAIGQ